MAYTLNTSHPLYANLVELIGVQSGALVSHKTARTFTKHADATYGTGTYGEHFAALAGGYTAKGASFSPYLTLNTSTKPNYTIVAVVNSSGAVQGGTVSLFLSRLAGGDSIRTGGKDSAGNAAGSRVTGAIMGTGARMVTYCRIGETAAKLYNNTTLDANLTGLGSDYNSPDARADYLCGWDGQNSMTASLVWLAVFDRELTGTEISDLYGSLGAANAFGLVESSGTQTLSPTIFTGTPTFYAPSLVYSRNLSPSVYNNSPNFFTAIVSVGGTIVTPPLKNNTGSLLASLSGWTVNVYDVSTGAFVLHKTGLSTDASGVLTISDAALSAATTYSYEPVHATYGRRLPIGTAS